MQAEKSVTDRCREVVEQAGFEFLGIFPEVPGHETLCLWKGKSGSTCALPVSRVTVNEVRAHSYSQDAAFRFRSGGAL